MVLSTTRNAPYIHPRLSRMVSICIHMGRTTLTVIILMDVPKPIETFSNGIFFFCVLWGNWLQFLNCDIIMSIFFFLFLNNQCRP